MSARTIRAGWLAATVFTLATLSLTACNGDEVTDGSQSSAGASGSEDAGAGQEGDQGADSGAGSEGATESTGDGDASDTDANDSGSGGSGSGDSGSDGDAGSSLNTPCTGANTETTVSEVSRPLNHLLLTVTNTGSEDCDLLNYPILRFEGAQSVPPAFEESQPQAVVTLAPGESGYAGVLLSSADGSGSNSVTAHSLEVFFHEGDAASANPELPEAGVTFDDSLTVTYWQSEMDDALTW